MGMLRYFLLEGQTEDGTMDYGVQVELAEECVCVPHITPVRSEAVSLLKAMRRGSVTPVAVRDIVEDWLLR